MICLYVKQDQKRIYGGVSVKISFCKVKYSKVNKIGVL